MSLTKLVQKLPSVVQGELLFAVIVKLYGSIDLVTRMFYRFTTRYSKTRETLYLRLLLKLYEVIMHLDVRRYDYSRSDGSSFPPYVEHRFSPRFVLDEEIKRYEEMKRIQCSTLFPPHKHVDFRRHYTSYPYYYNFEHTRIMKQLHDIALTMCFRSDFSCMDKFVLQRVLPDGLQVKVKFLKSTYSPDSFQKTDLRQLDHYDLLDLIHDYVDAYEAF